MCPDSFIKVATYICWIIQYNLFTYKYTKIAFTDKLKKIINYFSAIKKNNNFELWLYVHFILKKYCELAFY